jgi:hypothetical protein
MSDLESAWADAQKRLNEAQEAVKDATRNCKQTMEVIAFELWSVKHGDEVMFTPDRKQWKKAKVHCVTGEHGWHDSHEFWQFKNRPWLQLHPSKKDGSYSNAVVHGYPDAWLTIDEFERQQTAKMEAKQ